MKIAILTMFNGLSNTYSLVNVVREQLTMLLNDGIEVKMLVTEHCPDKERTGVFGDPRIQWIKITNSEKGQMFHWKTYTPQDKEVEKEFFHQGEIITKEYINHLQDVDVCILHDILYQGVHLLHNVAIREAQKYLPNLRFLSFSHSAPVPYTKAPYPINCMFSPMDNTTFVYPTSCGVQGVSNQYQCKISDCAWVSNSVDITIGLNDEVKTICKKTNLLEKDIIMVYPARLTMGKKFHVLAQVGGYIKKYSNRSVALVFCDFSSADIPPRMYKEIIIDYGKRSGLDRKDITFTSDIGFPQGVKRETVFDLFSLSNLFVCPSFSESFGLTVIEAASRGNHIVLNESVPALKEIGEEIGAHFMRWDGKNFGFDTYETYHPSEEIYLMDHTKKIVEDMENNPVLQGKRLVRQKYSSQWIYDNQLKPLIYGTEKQDNQ